MAQACGNPVPEGTGKEREPAAEVAAPDAEPRDGQGAQMIGSEMIRPPVEHHHAASFYFLLENVKLFPRCSDSVFNLRLHWTMESELTSQILLDPVVFEDFDPHAVDGSVFALLCLRLRLGL